MPLKISDAAGEPPGVEARNTHARQALGVRFVWKRWVAIKMRKFI
jgi:hypothetical protein